jgi:MraZ protein
MFSNQFDHVLDEKNRLTLPARYRPDLERGVFITRGLDKCLMAFTMDDFQVLADKIKNLQLTNETARLFSRVFFSNAIDVVPDRQGRVRIPDHLLRYAEIDTHVKVAGANLWFEIWNRDRWGEHQAYTDEHPDEVSKLFASLGI